MNARAILHRSIRSMLPDPMYWKFLSWRLGRFDPELDLVDALCDRSRISIDIGAANGAYTVHLLEHSRKCIAFEPRPDAASAIEARLTRHPNDRLQVEAVALSDRRGELTLRVLANESGRSTLEPANPIENLGTVHEVSVPVRCLDDYLSLDPVGFIKIDVEGHEEAVLRGALTLLRRDRPSLLVEIEERHNPGSVRRVTGLLGELGYAGYFYREGQLQSIDDFDPAVHQDERNLAGNVNDGFRYVNNFVFIARDSRARVRAILPGLH